MEEKKERHNQKRYSKKTDDKKTIKKETKTVKKENSNLITKETKKAFSIFGLFMIICSMIFSVILFIFSIVSVLTLAYGGKEALINNDFLVEYIAKINHYSIIEVENSIITIEHNWFFIIFEIILPTICIIMAIALIILFVKRIISFIDTIDTEKDLFTKDKIPKVKDLIEILTTALLITFVIFGEPSVFVYLLILCLLALIFHLYKRNCK